MSSNQAVQLLREKGYTYLNQPYAEPIFTENADADKLLDDLQNFPHAFTLACVMDRQVGANRAWMIPYEVSQEIGGFSFKQLLNLSLEQANDIFRKRSLHRFPSVMAKNFYLAVQRIHSDYGDNAASIWTENLRSGTIVRRFLAFKGAGVKIATMAANILARDFKVPMQDLNCIDISPDVQVRRVFTRLGLISKEAKEADILYCARELNPEYPGVFDLPCWELGQELCRPTNPLCLQCFLSQLCPKKV